ncbi:purine-cytosine permease [Tulasnella sp. JGI-2019a]|nr:purine-cytosine permease [Tulasnella sp. JGI-2019a]
MAQVSPHSSQAHYYDEKEKGLVDHDVRVDEVQGADVVALNDGVDRKTGPFAKLWKAVLWLDKFGVEVRGIERVPPNERNHTTIYDVMALWGSANLTISTFSLGTLGNSIWYLGLTDATLTILFFNLFCTLPVALFSTWGKSTGLRQMVITRFSYGRWGVYFPVLLNCIACIGWSTINTIVGASTLRAVSDTHKLPNAVGIIIIALLTVFVALFGYKYVHAFERYASIPIVVIFLIMLGEGAPHFTTGYGGSGPVEAASVLSFGSAIAGFALGWTSLAADYTVNFPENTSNLKVFLYTYVGLNVPLILVEFLGAAMMSTFTEKTTWGDDYTDGGLGGLLGAPLSPLGGFGKFLLVLLALSIVANNIPNMYSFALTFQVFGRHAQSIPRVFLVVLGTIIYIILAIIGASHFEEALNTLLTVLSYWLAIYTIVLIEEHYIFRGGSFSNYDLDSYNKNDLLPRGYAALLSTGFGIMGAVLGMSQTWYVGVIAKKIGDPIYGGDIGFELSGSFAAVTYPLFRYLEHKHYGV